MQIITEVSLETLEVSFKWTNLIFYSQFCQVATASGFLSVQSPTLFAHDRPVVSCEGCGALTKLQPAGSKAK